METSKACGIGSSQTLLIPAFIGTTFRFFWKSYLGRKIIAGKTEVKEIK